MRSLTAGFARLAVAAVVCCGAAGVEAQAPALQILGADSVTSELDTAGVVLRHTAYVRNLSGTPVSPRALLLVTADTARPDSLWSRPLGPPIAGASVAAITTAFDIPPHLRKKSFGGYLVVGDAGGTLVPAVRWMSVSPPKPAAKKRPPVFGNVISLPFFLALACVGAAALWLGGRVLQTMVGAPTWDFARSWASTTTLATAFANAGLIALLPKETQTGLPALTAVFAILVLVAPAAYNFTLRPVTENGETRHKGLVFCYLFSSLLTLWGVYGALYTGYLVVKGGSWDALTADGAIRWFQALPYLVGALITVYAVFTIRRTVIEQTRPPAASDDQPRTAGLEAVVPEPRARRAEAFPLL